MCIRDRLIVSFKEGKTDVLHSQPHSAEYVYEDSHIKAGNSIYLSDKTVDVVLRINEPDVVLIDNFLSDEECEALVNEARGKLTRSTVVGNDSGDDELFDGRTSENMFFKNEENEFIQRLENRISEMVNIPVENGEQIQVLNYSIGAEYVPHFDFFPKDTTGGKRHLGRGGQRVATVIMYLNDVESGGETVFPTIGLDILPRRGQALYFSYLNTLGQTDSKTLHGGAPVNSGEKWIATKWLRQDKYLP